MHKKGNLYIVSAPSGTGKSTVIRNLLKEKNDIFFSISATTRNPRSEETDGIEYHFLSYEKFEEMIHRNEFLEYAKYVGNYYGTPLAPILTHLSEGTDVLLDIEVQGHAQIIAKMPEAISIFLVPPSMTELEHRLRKRGTDSEETIQKRLKEAENELQHLDSYDYIVINDNSERAALEIISIMSAVKIKSQ